MQRTEMVYQVTEQEVCELARVSMIGLSKSEIADMRDHLSGIFSVIHGLSDAFLENEDVEPLIYPVSDRLNLREDIVTGGDCSSQLGNIAPFFEDGLYLVPPVLPKDVGLN